MSAETRATLKNFLKFGVSETGSNRSTIQVLSTIHLALLSPEFLIQR